MRPFACLSSIPCLWLLMATCSTATMAGEIDYLPPGEITKINIDKGEIPVLVRPWEGKQQLGSAIIIAPPGGSADEPGIIAYLRRELNPKGWASISPTPPALPAEPNFTTQPGEVARAGKAQLSQARNKALPKFTEEEAEANHKGRGEELIQTLNQLESAGAAYPGKRLLLAQDLSGGMIVELLAQNKIPMPDLLVLINAYREEDEPNLALASQLAELHIPVLDLISTDAHPLALTGALARLPLSRLKEASRYRQQSIALNLVQATAWAECLVLIEGFSRTALAQAQTPTQAEQ
jgi:hypothetical protein